MAHLATLGFVKKESINTQPDQVALDTAKADGVTQGKAEGTTEGVTQGKKLAIDIIGLCKSMEKMDMAADLIGTCATVDDAKTKIQNAMAGGSAGQPIQTGVDPAGSGQANSYIEHCKKKANQIKK